MTSAHTGRTTSESAINDYEKLLETGERSDVIIYAGENEEFRAHLSILCVRILLKHNDSAMDEIVMWEKFNRMRSCTKSYYSKDVKIGKTRLVAVIKTRMFSSISMCNTVIVCYLGVI
ncbi:BTB/POZ protein [Rhizophagus irregularis DAOM 181602=DAOM 197198]|nr:BTB/POZ protein [Rhizophagus irregularis DAOM 181602=DAOM 197198]CAB4397392.1 unnamed protein product [Rhizophagus irregularis]